jgi:hypothetical protein
MLTRIHPESVPCCKEEPSESQTARDDVHVLTGKVIMFRYRCSRFEAKQRRTTAVRMAMQSCG